MISRYNHNQSKKRWSIFWFLSLVFFHTSSHAGLIAFDLYDNKSQNLIEYNNPFQNGFSHSIDDSFQIHQQGATLISDGLLDNSNHQSDQLGLIEAGKDHESFFAVQDLDNPSNPSGQATASWTFDVKDASDLLVSVDIAAMGDFELSDWFRWDYSIDNLERKTLFELNTEQQKTQAYQMASGSTVSLDDPIYVNDQNPSNGLLNNHFNSFSKQILGTGFQLELFFTAHQNGGSEVLAFRNLIIEGDKNTRSGAAIPAPTTVALLLLGLCGLWVKSSIPTTLRLPASDSQ